MYCINCGEKILEGAKFCIRCGAKVVTDPSAPQSVENQTSIPPTGDTQPPAQPTVIPTDVPQSPAQSPIAGAEAPQPSTQPAASSAPVVQSSAPYTTPNQPPIAPDDTTGLGALVEKNQAYYLTEFSKLQGGGKSKFNWSAFLLNGAMCFYRRCEKLFLKYILPPLCAMAVVGIFSIIATATFNLTMMTISSVLAVLAGIFSLVWLIHFGLNFNREYFSICQEKLQAPSEKRKGGVSVKGMVLYWAACLAVVLVFNLIGSAISMAILQSLYF